MWSFPEPVAPLIRKLNRRSTTPPARAGPRPEHAALTQLVHARKPPRAESARSTRFRPSKSEAGRRGRGSRASRRTSTHGEPSSSDGRRRPPAGTPRLGPGFRRRMTRARSSPLPRSSQTESGAFTKMSVTNGSRVSSLERSQSVELGADPLDGGQRPCGSEQPARGLDGGGHARRSNRSGVGHDGLPDGFQQTGVQQRGSAVVARPPPGLTAGKPAA